MKLAEVDTRVVRGAIRISCIQENALNAVRFYRDLLRHQAEPIARKLGRLINRAEKAIRSGDANVVMHMRRLEEATNYVSMVRQNHPESQMLRRCIARIQQEMMSAFEPASVVFH